MPQKVVVIGGGYAGIEAAIGLDKAFDVTLVAGGDCFRHVVYGLRASAIPEETPRMLPSYDNMLKVCICRLVGAAVSSFVSTRWLDPWKVSLALLGRRSSGALWWCDVHTRW